MNFPLRTFTVAGRALARSRLGVLGESVLPMRVWPSDLDFNGHMNNGRYLTLMDLGRADLVIRFGLARVALAQRWQPLVGGATIRFRRSLLPFQRYRLHSQVRSWNAKWFFIEQRFEAGDVEGSRVHALAQVKVLLRGREGNIPSSAVLGALGSSGPSPEPSRELAAWMALEERG